MKRREGTEFAWSWRASLDGMEVEWRWNIRSRQWKNCISVEFCGAESDKRKETRERLKERGERRGGGEKERERTE